MTQNADYVLAHLMPGEGLILTKDESGAITAWEVTVNPLWDNRFTVHAYFIDSTIERAVEGLDALVRAQNDSSGA